GSGSGSFGGGGGGGGGSSSSFSGGGSSGSGSSGGDPIVIVIFFGIFGLIMLWLFLKSMAYRAKIKARDHRVRTASAEAAEDDAYFAADTVESEAEKLFRDTQEAWDKGDQARLQKLIGKDLF